MVIRGDHPFEGLAQNGPEHLGSPACGYGEVDNQRRNEDPKIAAISFALPSGLINVEIWRLGKRLPCFLRHRLQFRAYPVDAVAHAPKAQIQTEEGVHDLNYPSSADLMDRGEVGDGAMNSWPELTLRHLGGKLGPCSVTTGASQFMAAMLGHDRLDLFGSSKVWCLAGSEVSSQLSGSRGAAHFSQAEG